MHYLLDTHSLLWVLNGDKRLSDIARNIIEDRQHTKFVSMVSVWEVGIKISIGKLTFPENTIGFVKEIQKHGFVLLPINTSYIYEIEKLPLIHRDPFDRLLIATTISEEMTLITSDRNIALYDVPQIW